MTKPSQHKSVLPAQPTASRKLHTKIQQRTRVQLLNNWSAPKVGLYLSGPHLCPFVDIYTRKPTHMPRGKKEKLHAGAEDIFGPMWSILFDGRACKAWKKYKAIAETGRFHARDIGRPHIRPPQLHQRFGTRTWQPKCRCIRKISSRLERNYFDAVRVSGGSLLALQIRLRMKEVQKPFAKVVVLLG